MLDLNGEAYAPTHSRTHIM